MYRAQQVQGGEWRTEVTWYNYTIISSIPPHDKIQLVECGKGRGNKHKNVYNKQRKVDMNSQPGCMLLTKVGMQCCVL